MLFNLLAIHLPERALLVFLKIWKWTDVPISEALSWFCIVHCAEWKLVHRKILDLGVFIWVPKENKIQLSSFLIFKVRTPLFKRCHQTCSYLRLRLLWKSGNVRISCYPLSLGDLHITPSVIVALNLLHKAIHFSLGCSELQAKILNLKALISLKCHFFGFYYTKTMK